MAALVSLEGGGTLSRRVAKGLRSAIHAGRLKPGAKAPSSRRLAAALGVSRNVVLAVYEELIAEGYFAPRRGAGTFVSNLPPTKTIGLRTINRATPPAPTPSLSGFGQRAARLAAHRGYYDADHALAVDFQYWQVAPDAQSMREWARLARARLRRPRLSYSPPLGAGELREAIATHVAAARGIDVAAEDVIVVSGAQQALDLISRIVINPGDAVLMEEPHYQGARLCFEAEGARLRLAPVDDFGLDVGAVRLKACRLVYATPSHQFPTGAAMPFARRMALLEWARKKQAFLLEDDYDSEYQHDGKPIAALRALDDERVIYVATLARSYAPSLRLGFVIAPRPLREALASAKWLTDRGSPEFEQLVLADFISSGAYERHLRRMGKLYGERRTRLIESVRRHFGDEASVTGASAGVHVFMRLNLRNPADAPNVALAARKAGVGVYSACRYFVNMPKRGGFLLGYATTPPDLIDQGVARFARVWRDFKRAA